MIDHPFFRHEPDPANPGWGTWEIHAPHPCFNEVLGKLIVRADGPDRAVVRMFPKDPHGNFSRRVHGGVTMTFIDVSLFAGGAVAGADVLEGVTLDCQVQFIGAGLMDTHMDCEVELLRETGRLAFLRGRVVQGDHLVAAFSGTLRKGAQKAKPT